jgi:hypothetical protein
MIKSDLNNREANDKITKELIFLRTENSELKTEVVKLK